jgi:hypothetical protein
MSSNALPIILLNSKAIDLIKQEAAPKDCHPVQGMIEDQQFFEAYCEEPLNIYQLLQVVGVRVHVSKLAAWIIKEKHLSNN